eukprot:TRINITY_DN10374_c0_g1_i2.p1 TRINITY_DN10374_c0_g1~~TRINITY_DN10374_c0_g1_i2.p1  ORF type:complete len:505 (-),score=274.54 TRINITY_DN10374_c0_g1_i2:32-1546(-)
MAAVTETLTKVLAQAQSAITNVDWNNITKDKNAMYSLAGAGAVVVGGSALYKVATTPKLKTTKIAEYAKPDVDVYDVAVVGAGPSGSTLSYYLSKQGHNILLLEKKEFPRDKYCGDAVALGAQKIMKEMGVLQEIERENKGFYAQSGGFVSPAGNSFIGNSAKELGIQKGSDPNNQGGVVIAIKRIVLDEKVAKAAKNAGAKLTENTTVTNCTFIEDKGIWKVECVTTNDQPVTYYARVLVCADGSPSRLARQLGYVKTEPQGMCSRAYVKDNTLFNCDGLIFYPTRLLPGYCAIIREAGNELNFCTYIIPGGKVTNDDLPRLHDEIMKYDPYVSKLLGPNPNIERMRAATLRLGGIEKSFGHHLIIIGDAAGFIDPLTGEGIQYAFESGKLGAEVLRECLLKGDVSEKALKKYHDTWWGWWGWKFYMSMKMSLLLYRFPIMLDAACKLVEKRGARFLAEWAQVMTGGGSKTWFLRLDVWPFICYEILAQMGRNLFGKNLPQRH